MANPIVKWAGGKRQIINKLLEYMPPKYNDYYEPFIGGGALLLELMPNKAVINDVNSELLSIYRCMQNEEYYQELIKLLKEHEQNHSEDYFYEVRDMDRNEDFLNLPLPIRAARALYLNKSCFNGLYRVNAKGYFNVPSARKAKVNTFDEENFKAVHDYFMKHVTILEGDFVKAVENAKKGDLVYFDPPYDPIENKESFTSYTKDDFGKDDQKRLADLFKELDSKGVYAMLSNHNTKYINELYKGFNIHVINAKRMINADSKGRGNVEEVIITNY